MLLAFITKKEYNKDNQLEVCNMVKILNVSADPTQLNSLSQFLTRMILAGAFLGLIYGLLLLIFKNFFTINIAGDISMVIAAIGGTALLVFLKTFQPLIIAIAASFVLWGLAGWLSGLNWAESIVWSAFLFGVSYALFSLVIRYSKLPYVVVFMASIIIIARVVVSL
jgi:hypothetical protein